MIRRCGGGRRCQWSGPATPALVNDHGNNQWQWRFTGFGWMLVAVSFPDADLVAQHPEGHERIGLR